jgi:hypothetical protein
MKILSIRTWADIASKITCMRWRAWTGFNKTLNYICFAAGRTAAAADCAIKHDMRHGTLKCTHYRETPSLLTDEWCAR